MSRLSGSSNAARGSVVVDAVEAVEIDATPAPAAPTAKPVKRPPPPSFSSSAVKELEHQQHQQQQPASPRGSGNRPMLPKLSPRELLSPLVVTIGDTPLIDCAAQVGEGAEVTLPEADTIAGKRKRRVLGELQCKSRAELLERVNLKILSAPLRPDAVVINLAADDLAKQLEHAPLSRVVHGSGATCAEDAVYAALTARRNLTSVLQRFVDARDLTEVEAMEVALNILFRNSQR
jgi:hypothetical protein